MIDVIVASDMNAMIAMTGTIAIAATIVVPNASGARTIALPHTMSARAMMTGAMPVRRAGTAMTATGGAIIVTSVTIAVIVRDIGTPRDMAITA